MAAKQFTDDEWAKINATLRADPKRYGLPQREYGSVLLGSFNIRKIGNTRNRSPETWQFLAETCRSFDLIAVQESRQEACRENPTELTEEEERIVQKLRRQDAEVRRFLDLGNVPQLAMLFQANEDPVA